MADRVLTLDQAVAHGDTAVEDETLTAPQAVIFGNGLEIFQNSALEVEHLVQAFIEGDGHWTPFGHRVVADRLADWLAAQPDLPLDRTH